MKEENNHKLGLILPKSTRYCMGVTVCIDRERINAMGLYPVDMDGRKLSPEQMLDTEWSVAELEVANIEEIAFLMNKETFEKFCKLWRGYHETER